MRRALLAVFVGGVVAVRVATTLVAQTAITFQYFYDDAGQLTRVVDSTGTVIDYVYDAVGNMVEVRRSNVNPAQLSFMSFAPTQGAPGTLVTIRGTGFSPEPTQNTVAFSGSAATVVSASQTELVVSVPATAVTGVITVGRDTGVVTSDSPFTVLSLPRVTSVAPRTIDAAQPPPSIRVTGTNLAGARFEALPELSPAAISFGAAAIDTAGADATIPVAVSVASTSQFVITAITDSGRSDSVPSPGNTLTVVNTSREGDFDGDGYPDGLELIFGSDPTLASSMPNLRAFGSLRSSFVSLKNSLLPPGVATVQEARALPISVLNRALDPGLSLSNELRSLTFSLFNAQADGARLSNDDVASTTGRPETSEPLNLTLEVLSTSDPVVAGQTVLVRARGARPDTQRVEFRVNGTLFETLSRAPFEWLLTIPHGISRLGLEATALMASGARSVATPRELGVMAASLVTVSGRVVDARGNPLAGAAVELLSEGLDVEVFDVEGPLESIPSLTTLAPALATRVTAINTINPRSMFGSDPHGTRLTPDYLSRLTGSFTARDEGSYTFTLGASEAARLSVNGVTLIDMTGAGATDYRERESTVTLPRGSTPIEVIFFQGTGSGEVRLQVAGPSDTTRHAVSPASLTPPGRVLRATTDEAGRFQIRGVPSWLASAQVGAIAADARLTGMSTLMVPSPREDTDVGDIPLTAPRAPGDF